MLLLIPVMTGALCVGHPGVGQFFLIASCVIVLVPVVRCAAAMAQGARGALLGAGAAFACLLPLLLMPFVPRLQALARYSSSWLDPLDLIEEILLFPPRSTAVRSAMRPSSSPGCSASSSRRLRRGALVGAWGALIAVLVVGDTPEGRWWAFAGGSGATRGVISRSCSSSTRPPRLSRSNGIVLRLFDRLAPSGGRVPSSRSSSWPHSRS